MRLTAQLAYNQLKTNRKRAVWTLAGIVLSVAMITAVYGFAASGIAAMHEIVGGELRDVYYATVAGIGAVMSAIIITASVIVISNSFRVSAGERLSQFGMLKSVGATKRQIAAIIMYESLYLSFIGIPLGVGTGLLVQFIGIQISSHFIEMVRHVQDAVPLFDFVLAWQGILLAVAVGLGTVLLSAWLPAYKAAKIPAINAIRKVGDVTVNQKQVRTSRVIYKLFGFEGALASKSLKRSRRNFRASVVSLSVSIILFIAAGSFGTHLARMTAVVMHMTDADVWGYYMSTMRFDTLDGMQLQYYAVDNELAAQITTRLRDFPHANVIGVGTNNSSFRVTSTSVPVDMLTTAMRDRYDPYRTAEQVSLNISLVTVDAITYARLLQLANVPDGSNILINYYRAHINERWTEFTPFNFAGQTITMPGQVPSMMQATVGESLETHIEIPLHGQLRYEQIPREILHTARNGLVIVVPELAAKTYNWYIQTNDPNGFAAFMHEVFDDMLPRGSHDLHPRTSILNLQAAQAGDRAIVRLVMVFAYGFVGMLTLIGLTNVISTISTNVRSRAREFAILQSVGMTGGGLDKMLNLESILCSAKSLLIGLPLGVLASYLIYLAVLQSVDFGYRFPFVAVGWCVLAVFIITWVTMRYAAARLRGNNIVDTIRGVE